MSVTLVNSHVLLPDPPNWNDQPTWSRIWQTEIGDALTGAEARGALRQLPRLKLTYTVTPLSLPGAAAFDDRLRAALKSGKAAVPYWGRCGQLAADASGTSATLVATAWPWQEGDYIFFLDLSDPPAPVFAVRQITGIAGAFLTLDAALPQTFKAGSEIWPMLFGKLEAADVDLITGQRTKGQLTLTERVSSVRPGDAAATTYLTRPVYTQAIDWSDTNNRSLSFDLKELAIGFGAEMFSPLQLDVAHGFALNLRLRDEEEILGLDNFLAALHGRLLGFWLPSPLELANVVAGINTTHFDITAQGLANTWQDHPSQHIWVAHGGAAAGTKITAVTDNGDGTERVTVSPPLPWIVTTEDLVHRLHYVRLADDEETSTFVAEWRDQRPLKLIELPTEYVIAETGEQPVYLYHIWLETDPEQHWYYTSFAVDIVSGGQTYTAKSITHDAITRTTTGKNEQTTLTAFYEAGHPLAFGLPFPPSRPIRVQILETTYPDPDTVTIIFTGQVESAPRTGRKISAPCKSLLDLDSQKLLGALINPRCAFHVYDSATCGANRATFQKTGCTFTVIDGRTVRVSHATKLNGWTANYFTFGWIETGSGGTEELRTILQDTVISSTVRELILNLPLQFAIVGQTVTVLPGCDGKWATCTGKFSNTNFFGHPYVPQDNPTLTALSAATSQGGKK